MTKDITIIRIIDLIPVSTTTYNNNKDKLNFEKLFLFFDSDEYTTLEKRDYLYDLIGIPRRLKDAIWNAYMGDTLNKYANIPDIEYEGDE